MNAAKVYRGAEGVDFVEAVWPGQNTSGLKVHGRNILVIMDEAARVTTGGVHVPDDEVWKRTNRSMTGILVGLGPNAFQFYDNGEKWTGEKPEPGDRVMIEMYAGHLLPGLDEKIYRVMDAKNVIAGYTDEGLAAMEND